MPFATIWKDLEIIIPSEVNQKKTNIIWYLLHVESKRKKKTVQMNLIYKTDTDSQPQETNLWLPEGKGGRDKLEVWD